jgi:hypothetical protein
VNRALFSHTADELAGAYGPVVQADAHGRILTGTAFLAGGIMLNRMGILTGAGPQNPTDRKVWLLEHQPYSIRMGDQWVRYDRYDVIGGLLSIPATIVDATTNVQEDKTYGEILLSGVVLWHSGSRTVPRCAELLACWRSATIPPPTLQRVRPAHRRHLPGFVPNADPSPDHPSRGPLPADAPWLGGLHQGGHPRPVRRAAPRAERPRGAIQRPANSVGEGLFPITIAPAVTFKRTRWWTRSTGSTRPPATARALTQEPRLRLTSTHETCAGERAEPLRCRHAGPPGDDPPRPHPASVPQPCSTAPTTMRAWTPILRKDDQPGGRQPKLHGRAGVQRLQQAIKSELAQGSPTANAWLTAAAAKQRDDAYLKDVSAKDLVHNPDLYHTHGIDPSVYSDKVREGATGALAQALQRR